MYFFSSTPERGSVTSYLHPDANLYDNMSVVGLSIDYFDIHFCLEHNEQSKKSFMLYTIPRDGESAPSSRQYISKAEDLAETASKFRARQPQANQHDLFVLNQDEYKQFYNKLEEIWWCQPKYKSFYTTMLEATGLQQSPPTMSRKQELEALIESIAHLNLSASRSLDMT